MEYSNTKRGQLTDQMLEDQYKSLLYQRFSGENGCENRGRIIFLIQKNYFYNQLAIQFGTEYVDWKNPGFNPFHPELQTFKNLTKWSFVCNLYYNFMP